jgi:uncharacterized protein (TIGR03083 family)
MIQSVPINTVHLFPILDENLIQVLRSLSTDEWNEQTLARHWKVKDVAAHLLDGNLRMLSIQRDRYQGDPPEFVGDYNTMVQYLNRLNADWVKATKRISPPVLIELLEITGKAYCDVIQSLDPFSEAIFSVAWAGQEVSPNWFHIAREYTEKWHHQQQIRVAVGKPGIMTRDLFYPVIDTFMCALPHTYKEVTATEGTEIEFEVMGELGGRWYLKHLNSAWTLSKTCHHPVTFVRLAADTAWKLFTHGMNEGEASKRISIEGDESMGAPFLRTIAVMA